MAAANHDIRIFTLNCWGLKFLSKQHNARLSQIGRQIAAMDPAPALVGLQECWTQADYDAIRAATASVLPHGKFYYNGAFGAGLAILSRWPIDESAMVGYSLNGRPTAFHRGDWFVGKGIACATVRIPASAIVPAAATSADGGRDILVDVFCTHMHAPYDSVTTSYRVHRASQAWEFARLLRTAAAKSGRLVVGLGDLNCLPRSMQHRLITAHAPVVDVWRLLHPHSLTAEQHADPNRRVPTVHEAVVEHGATSDTITNTWRGPGPLSALGSGGDNNSDEERKKEEGDRHDNDNDNSGGDDEKAVPTDSRPDPRAQRLDYIFIGGGPDVRRSWAVRSARVTMTELHPTLGCSLSDHFAVEAVVAPVPDDRASDAVNTTGANTYCSLASASDDETPAVETYDTILAQISAYVARERFQRRFRIADFVLAFVVMIGCLVAQWFVPARFVGFILNLVSVVGMSLGVIDLLIGVVFMSGELRRLKEFEWEIRNARRIAVEKAGEEGRG